MDCLGREDSQGSCRILFLMIELYTFAELSEQQYTLALYCLSCDRWGKANLDWLIQIGKGDKPVTEAIFRSGTVGRLWRSRLGRQCLH